MGKKYQKGDIVKVKCILGKKREKDFYSWTVGKQGEIFKVLRGSATGKYIVKLYNCRRDSCLLYDEEELEPIGNSKIHP